MQNCENIASFQCFVLLILMNYERIVYLELYIKVHTIAQDKLFWKIFSENDFWTRSIEIFFSSMCYEKKKLIVGNNYFSQSHNKW